MHVDDAVDVAHLPLRRRPHQAQVVAQRQQPQGRRRHAQQHRARVVPRPRRCPLPAQPGTQEHRRQRRRRRKHLQHRLHDIAHDFNPR
ncbi:hypothetical protein [Archangium sp.]|uniref:hypothetical protein n=1 Tax=Archangium sp. TaxID=1872627 RepID=UPI0039C8593F